MNGFTNKEIDKIQNRLDEIWMQGLEEKTSRIKDDDVRESFVAELYNGTYTLFLEPTDRLIRFVFSLVRDNPKIDFSCLMTKSVVCKYILPYSIGSYYLRHSKIDLSKQEMQLLYIESVLCCLWHLRIRKYKDE